MRNLLKSNANLEVLHAIIVVVVSKLHSTSCQAISQLVLDKIHISGGNLYHSVFIQLHHSADCVSGEENELNSMVSSPTVNIKRKMLSI